MKISGWVLYVSLFSGYNAAQTTNVAFVPMTPEGKRLRDCTVTKLYLWSSSEDVTTKRSGPLTFEHIPEGIYGMSYSCEAGNFVMQKFKIDADNPIVPVVDLARGDRISFRKGTPLGLHVRLLADKRRNTETGQQPWMRVTELITGRSWTTRLTAESSGVVPAKPALYSITVADPSERGLCVVQVRVDRYFSSIELDIRNACDATRAEGLAVLQVAHIQTADSSQAERQKP
jgi:hypothetical protein